MAIIFLTKQSTTQTEDGKPVKEDAKNIKRKNYDQRNNLHADGNPPKSVRKKSKSVCSMKNIPAFVR